MSMAPKLVARECPIHRIGWSGPPGDPCPRCHPPKSLHVVTNGNGYGQTPVGDVPIRDLLDAAHLVDWPAFWNEDHAEEEWAAYPILPKGRSIAIYAEAKVGKSSIILAAVAALATGQPIYGQAAVEPVDVLYLDYEMSAADLMERMSQLGYGPDVDLSRLHYALLPSMPPLDTAAGGNAVVELVEQTGSKVVIVDTFGRAIAGEENEADSVRAYYRHTAAPLKRLNVTQARLDHAGKDATKGQRGSSAKADDVDLVWRARRTDDGAELIRTHSRPSWVPERVGLLRKENDDGEIRWALTGGASVPAGTKAMIDTLERLGIPVGLSGRKAGKMLRDAGETGRNAVIWAAQRQRSSLWINPLESAPKFRGAPSGDLLPEPTLNDGAHPANPLVDEGEHLGEQLGAGDRASGEHSVRLRRAHGEPQPPSDTPEIELF